MGESLAITWADRRPLGNGTAAPALTSSARDNTGRPPIAATDRGDLVLVSRSHSPVLGWQFETEVRAEPGDVLAIDKSGWVARVSTKQPLRRLTSNLRLVDESFTAEGLGWERLAAGD